MADHTLDEKIDVLAREVRMRKNAYPKWVAQGRLSQAEADHQISVMESVLRDYAMQKEPGLF